MASVKDQMLHIIHNQPDDSSYDEILKELAFHRMIEHGLADSKQSRTISNQEMEHRIRSFMTESSIPAPSRA